MDQLEIHKKFYKKMTMNGLIICEENYFKISDLRKFNPKFFKGNNWRNIQNRFGYGPNASFLVEGCGLDALYLDQGYLSVKWAKENIPDPNKDYYCYW